MQPHSDEALASAMLSQRLWDILGHTGSRQGHKCISDGAAVHALSRPSAPEVRPKAALSTLQVILVDSLVQPPGACAMPIRLPAALHLRPREPR